MTLPVKYTPAQDKAMFDAIKALPVQTVAAAILFLLIRDRPDRQALQQLLSSL